MKSKKLLSAMMVGILAVGGTQAAFAGVAKKTVNPQKVQATQVKNKDEATKKQEKEMAAKVFEKYFNENLDVNKLNAISYVGEEGGNKLISITMTDQKLMAIEGKNYVNMNKGKVYKATIDVKSGKVLHANYFDNNKKVNIQNFDIEEAKNIASEFIQKNELLNAKDVQFNEKDSKEVSKDSNAYYLYFKYDTNKTLLITVDKTDKKVTQLLFIDETNARG